MQKGATGTLALVSVMTLMTLQPMMTNAQEVTNIAHSTKGKVGLAKEASGEVITAKEAGLIADGKTDNGPILNKFIHDNTGAYVINFDAGDYYFGGNTVLMRSNLTFNGATDGQTVFTGGEVFHYPSSTAGYDGGVQNVFWNNIEFKSPMNTEPATKVKDYADGSTLYIDNIGKNPDKHQLGKAVDNVTVPGGKTYILSVTYQTSDPKSDSVTLQLGDNGTKWSSKTFTPITDGQEHTVSFEAPMTSNKMSYYAGTQGNFNGKLTGMTVKDKDTGTDVLKGHTDLNKTEWRLWAPNYAVWATNVSDQAIMIAPQVKNFTQSLIHAKNIHFTNCNFNGSQPDQGHSLDITGSSYIYVDKSTFQGFGTVKGGTYDFNKEALQVDYDNNGAQSYTYASDNRDGIASHHIVVTNNQFLPIKQPDGTIISYAPNPIGEHSVSDNASLGNENHIHDITFDNNYVLDAIPAKKAYMDELTDNVTLATSKQWDYAGHAIIHMPDVSNLSISNNVFEQDEDDQKVTDGYIRLINFDGSNPAPYSNISIKNNDFKSIKSTRPYIDFSNDGRASDVAGTTYPNATVTNNNFINGSFTGDPVRTHGINSDNSANSNISVTGTLTANNKQTYTDKWQDEDGKQGYYIDHGKEVYYTKDGYSPKILTIKQVDQKGKTLGTFDEKGYYAHDYNVNVPAIKGYTAKTTSLTGTFGVKGETKTVEYIANKVTITIKMLDENGKELGTKQITGDYNDSYSLDAPVIKGYTPTKSKVEGKYGDDTVVTVKYTKGTTAKPTSPSDKGSATGKGSNTAKPSFSAKNTGKHKHNGSKTTDKGTKSDKQTRASKVKTARNKHSELTDMNVKSTATTKGINNQNNKTNTNNELPETGTAVKTGLVPLISSLLLLTGLTKVFSKLKRSN